MLRDEVAVVVLQSDLGLGGFVQGVSTESDRVLSGSHLQDPCNNNIPNTHYKHTIIYKHVEKKKQYNHIVLLVTQVGTRGQFSSWGES